MVLDPQDVENVSPKQKSPEGNTKLNSVRDFINNMTLVGAQKPPNKVSC